MNNPFASVFRAVGLVFLLALLGLGIVKTLPADASSTQLPPRCDNFGDYGSTLEQDTTWTGDVYLGRDLIVRGNATLTITSGVHVYFCGDYSLSIGSLFDPARLNAVGTTQDPIVFQPVDGVTNWGQLYFGDSLDQASFLQHTILRKGGGLNPNETDAVLFISDRHSPPDLASPIIDRVTVEQSSAYGIRVAMDNENDPMPPSLTRVTITGSARAPFLLEAAAVSGLGREITTSGNAVEAIQVEGDSLNGGMFFDQRWRKHGIPYEILGSLYIRNNDNTKTHSTWIIDPGVTLLIHSDKDITIGSLYGDARLLVRGTEDMPVTFDRLDDQSAPWGSIIFDAFSVTDSELRWTNLLYGGGLPDEREAVLDKAGKGTLTLNHVAVKLSMNAAVEGTGGAIQVNRSLFQSNRRGINLWDTQSVWVRNSQFAGNSEGGLINNRPKTCVYAPGNWWGHSSGPGDSSAITNDGCAPAGRTNAGSGDSVSDGVIYWPWLQSGDFTVQDRSSISPGDMFYIIADGVDAGQLTVTLRDANGQPRAGKEVRLETTRGVLAQPTTLTDALGRTTAVITGTEIGPATITGINVTDNKPLETQTMVTFWQGPGDTGGLVDPGGTPYARPELLIEGEPFQVGFPVVFRLRMRNANATPVDVQVTYRVSSFGIGLNWTPVTTVSNTLAPGASWDALGGFTVPDTAHRCVAYELQFTTPGGQHTVLGWGFFSGQRNIKKTTPPPSDSGECKTDVYKLIPRSGGFRGVIKHGANMGQQMNGVRCNLNTNLRRSTGIAGAGRDYESIVTPRTFTGQALAPGNGVTQSQSDAATTMAQAVAQLASLNLAVAETYDRLQAASQAEDWGAALAQTQAYQDFQRQRADALDAVADAADALVAANQDAGLEETFTHQDYAAYLAELKTNGYDAETRAFHQATGLTDEEINAMLQAEIAALEESLPTTATEFNAILQELAAESRATAQKLRPFFPTTRAENEALQRVAANQVSFAVGNPTDTKATVELVVRPVDLPLQWTAFLDRAVVVELDAGAETQVTLTLDPGDQPVLKDVDVQVAVEGYINGELIGGVLVRQRVPGSMPNTIFLPMVQR